MDEYFERWAREFLQPIINEKKQILNLYEESWFAARENLKQAEKKLTEAKNDLFYLNMLYDHAIGNLLPEAKQEEVNP